MALVLLAKLGLRPEDLTAGAAAVRRVVATFAEFVPQVAEATTAGSGKAYGSYWNRVVREWGGRRLDEPTPIEIVQLGRRSALAGWSGVMVGTGVARWRATSGRCGVCIGGRWPTGT